MSEHWTPFQNQGIPISLLNSSNRETLDSLRELAAEHYHALVVFCATDPAYSSLLLPALAFDPSRDRFKDVLPEPASTAVSVVRPLPFPRVGRCSFTLNANTVFGNTYRYICTQSPTENTTSAFWQMVNDENVNLIVTLNDLESGVHRYWPANEDPTNGPFYAQTLDVARGAQKLVFPDSEVEIEFKRAIQLPGVEGRASSTTIRSFLVRNKATAKERSIVQMHFHGWPDKASPVSAQFPEMKQFLETFYKYLYGIKRSQRTSMVVHCKAGIGRTGTFLAIDALVHKLGIIMSNGSKSSNLDVLNTVLKLRTQRRGMVQTQEQYTFIHLFLRYLLVNKSLQ